MDKKLKELLYRSFDDTLEPDEQSNLDEGLKTDHTLQKERDEIQNLRKQIKNQPVRSFSPGFTDRVLTELFSGENNFDVFIYRLFKPFAVAASLLIAIMLSYNIATADKVTIDTVLAIPDINMSETADLVYFSDLIVE